MLLEKFITLCTLCGYVLELLDDGGETKQRKNLIESWLHISYGLSCASILPVNFAWIMFCLYISGVENKKKNVIIEATSSACKLTLWVTQCLN